MEVILTKNADKLICLIYKEYLRRCSNGVAKAQAVNFDVGGENCDAFNDFPKQDFSATLRELKDAGMLKVYIYDDFKLEPAGIIYMEQRFPNGISQVLDWLAKLKNAIPFA